VVTTACRAANTTMSERFGRTGPEPMQRIHPTSSLSRQVSCSALYHILEKSHPIPPMSLSRGRAILARSEPSRRCGDGPRGQTDTIADGPLAPRTASRTAVRHLTGRISARTSLCFVGYRRCSGNGLSSCLPLFRFLWCSNALHAMSFILIGLAIASLGLPLTASIPNKPLARILPQQRLQL